MPRNLLIVLPYLQQLSARKGQQLCKALALFWFG